LPHNVNVYGPPAAPKRGPVGRMQARLAAAMGNADLKEF